MAAWSDLFELKVEKAGSGYPAIYVRLRNWFTPPSAKGSGMVFISLEIINEEDLDNEIDSIIDQLQALKKKGRKMLPKLGNMKS